MARQQQESNFMENLLAVLDHSYFDIALDIDSKIVVQELQEIPLVFPINFISKYFNYPSFFKCCFDLNFMKFE